MRRGFTLVEILVAMGILVLIGGAIATFGRDIFFSNSILSSRLSAQDDARRVFKLMSAEIRSTSPGATGAYPIVEAGASNLTFYSDIDNDGLTERVRYFLSGNILKRGVIKPTGSPLTYNLGNEVLSDVLRNVTVGPDPIFSYFDSSYDGTTSPLSLPADLSVIRLVKISLSNFTTQVALRNLKDDL